MKKIKTFLMGLIVLASLAGCQANSSKLPKVTFYEHMDDIQSFLYNEEQGKVENLGISGGEYDFFNHSVIPYCSLDSYVKSVNDIADMLTFAKLECQTDVVNHVVTLINKFNGAKMIIDFDKQQISYDDYTAYYTVNPTALCTGDYLTSSVETGFFIGNPTANYQKGHDVVIDLEKYNIKGYFFNNQGYLPDSFTNLMGYGFNADRLGSVYFNGRALYSTGYSEMNKDVENYYKIIRESDTIIGEEFMQYNYDMLAFLLDYKYGMIERDKRSLNKRFTYLPEGAYKALEPYKEDLLSLEPNVSTNALFDFSYEELDDGGHTRLESACILNDIHAPHYKMANDRGWTFKVLDDLVKTRKALGLAPDQKITSEDELIPNAYYEEIEGSDTAFITFDTFTQNAGFTPIEFDSSKVTDETYWTNTIYLTTYANRKIRENNIKNVVIDLSVNTGGAVLAEQFMESWLCGGNAYAKELDTVSGSVFETVKHADVNMDGKFDELDYLPDDINVYCIVSPASFSCGNLLPTRLKEGSNCKFIGDRSGGGCCTVESFSLPNIHRFSSISSSHNSLRKDSTIENPVSVDDGVTADFYKIPLMPSFYECFYDRAEIVNRINAK